MMKDSDRFHGFLSSLSGISELDFQVWDANGLLFLSGPDRAGEVDLEDSQAFSAHIINQGSYQRASGHGRPPMLGAPIKYEQQTIGALIAYEPNSRPESRSENDPPGKTYDAKEMETFLTNLANLMGETWANQKDMEEMAVELSQNFEELSLHARISTHLRSLKFSGTMVSALIEELQETLRVDLSFVRMPKRQEYNAMVSATGLSDRISDQKAFVDNLIGRIPGATPSLEQDYFIVNDSRTVPEFRQLHPEQYRFLAIKVGHDSHFDGWLGLVSFNMKEIFRQGELRLLQSMAKQISVLLANMDLYHELQHFVINMVKSLVYAIEAKDIYTRGHSERVNRYAMLMAERLKLDKTEKEILNWASILHDIGKIGIPESVLNKPGSLDDEEFRIIKGHPEKGYNILEPLEQISECLPGVLHHHERYDGRGHPHGLKGEDIPFLARIIAVADTFDAITSSRAYRSSKSPEEALAIMDQAAGTQLSPDLVEVFKDVFATVLKQEFESTHDEQGCGDKAIETTHRTRRR